MRTSPMDVERVEQPGTTPRRRQLGDPVLPSRTYRWHPTAVKGRAGQGVAAPSRISSAIAPSCRLENRSWRRPPHQHGATAMPVAFTMTLIALPLGSR